MSETKGFIQWKSSDVCIDYYCKCGNHSHFDGYFAYTFECPECQTIYTCSSVIELIEIKQTQNTINK